MASTGLKQPVDNDGGTVPMCLLQKVFLRIESSFKISYQPAKRNFEAGLSVCSASSRTLGRRAAGENWRSQCGHNIVALSFDFRSRES
jgi:hypothetical protein